MKLSTQLAITRVIRLISLKLFQDPEICFPNLKFYFSKLKFCFPNLKFYFSKLKFCFPNLNFIKGGVKLSTQLAITRVIVLTSTRF